MLDPSVFASAFHAHPVGTCLLSPAPEAVVLAVNDSFLRAAGRRREDLVGRSIFEVFPGNPDDSADSGVAALRASLARVAASGQTETLPAQRYPIAVTLPNGETVYEERFWDATSTPVHDADGRLICIAHSTADVTTREQAAAARAETEQRYRALTEATADVIYRMSPDWSQMHELEGRGLLENAREPTRYWLDAYVPPADRARVNAAIDEAIRCKRIFELEHRVLRADGSIGWTLSRAIPMLDAQGNIREWLGAASDITERKLAEEKLAETARRKDQFLAMLAHELRNPLAPVGAAAQLLMMKQDDPLVCKSSAIISRQVAHMKGLIDDLLDMSRVSSGLITLERAPVSLGDVLAEAVEQVTPLMQARRHLLEWAMPPEGLLTMGDRKRLVQVFANILNNAAKYTPDGGRLRIATVSCEQELRVEITDNGVGMTPELARQAFDLFTQAERTPDRASGGLGLGLALVRNLVELHGGRVSCESAGPGQGSRFTVALPRSLPLQPSESGQHPHQLAPGALDIMVVDDNADAADMLAMLLGAWGHRVAVAHSPHEALDKARPSTSMFLLDIGLPEMDGYELCRALRARPENADAVLVAVTGYGQESDRQRAAEAGFDEYLVKPVDIDALRSVLQARQAH